MSDKPLAEQWSKRFGLARSPMFESDAPVSPGEHHVLLDGGYGSFGLSVVDERTDPEKTASWAWSSDIPHHVSVHKNEVQVVRWDSPNNQNVYSIGSVLRNLDGFYKYICQDRLVSNRTVVQHLVNIFGRVRSLVAYSKLPDERTIDAFITVLADLIAGDGQRADPQEYGLPNDAEDLRGRLSSLSLTEAKRDLLMAPASLSTLCLYPSLTLRHASGQLFQEAHFDLVRAPPPDMFGYVEVAATDRVTRGGAHFTPPALARSIVDHTLAQIDGLADKTELTICDPACGSAAFLHEAIRGLRRTGFKGHLKIIGRDISSSAISMARFTLKLALRDWTPMGGASLDLVAHDSLEGPSFPVADVVVMNPPFISVIAQTAEQKQQLRSVVGDKAASRGDYSMAFVTRALEAITPGGAMGTLFPANLLTHEASGAWRENLSANGDMRLLASIGDFGMFSQALVHVACVVLSKPKRANSQFTVLTTGNEVGATGDALRELRKLEGQPPPVAVSDRQWKLFAADAGQLAGEGAWRILTPQQRSMLDALEAVQTPTVADLFDISQGVQTGKLKVFLLSEEDYRSLPPKEKRYFRKAVMTDSIRDGKIVREYYLFFPHNKDGSLFSDEAALEAAVPHYYRNVLKPNENSLRKRAAIVRADRRDWWGLMHARKFSFENSPRIVSKFFGAEGSFILDLDAQYLPSTGHVWTPKLRDTVNENEDESSFVTYDATDVLRAYVALLNSRFFIRLVSFRSVTVSGGQFDLSRRFVAGVFIPNLWDKAEIPMMRDLIRRLAKITLNTQRGEWIEPNEAEQLVARLYGVPPVVED